MIGGNKNNIVICQSGSHYSLNTLVYGFSCFYHASKTPVWPTISALAKFRQIKLAVL